ncbi:MAG TPA: hypothetical protein VJZ71_12275 [Phycisphaerae bacterium]|nr:hypothetical protein [Phycisphaerae bacterium]
MRQKLFPVCFAIFAVSGAVSVSFAALLGVIPGFPVITYDSNGTTSYNATSDALALVASPISIRFSPSTPPRLITPTGIPASEVLQIGASISDTGAVLSGVPGDDLVVQGQIDADGNGSIDYSGILLTGEIIAFGFEDTGTATDRYDFRFAFTGGSLASFFAGQDIGVTVTSENSDFVNNFNTNIIGGAKGSLGPIPRLNQPPVCNANGPYQAECAGGVTTLMLDGSQSSDPDAGTTLTYSWTSDCPGATFDDATSATPVLSVDTSSGCNIQCTLTLSVSDGTAAPQTCQAEVSVSDTNNPTITCPGEVTVQCGTSTAPADTGGPATADDDCDPAPIVSHTDTEEPGSCPQSKIITRTWKAEDRCGNSATCVQTINVVDTTAPTITTCPGAISVTCEQGTNPTVTGTPTAEDNCDAAPTFTFNDESTPANCPAVAVVTRTWTASDACGNTSTCVQTITVTDSIGPSVHCPADVEIECDESSLPASTGMATADDGCDPNPTVTYTDSVSGSCPTVIERTWRATDACGQGSTCVQRITVVDTTPPDLVCPPNVTLNCAESTDASNTGRATVTDNCDGSVEVTFTDVRTGTCPATIVRTWAAEDGCHNRITCDQTITLQDAGLCPATPGYWKNHRSRWPVSSLTVGGVTYNDAQLMRLLSNKLPNGQNAGSDMSAALAKFVIAATFNVLSGSDSQDIQPVLDAANAFLASFPPGSNPRGGDRYTATQLKDQLDVYCNSNPSGCRERN